MAATAQEPDCRQQKAELPAKTPVVKTAAIEGRSAAHKNAAANDWPAHANPDEVPVARDPVAVIPVAADPCVSRSRACRNGDCATADIKSDSSCLGRRRGHGQRSHCQCCSQYQLLHAAHNPSILRGPIPSPARLAATLELVSCCSIRLTVLLMSNTGATQSCGRARK